MIRSGQLHVELIILDPGKIQSGKDSMHLVHSRSVLSHPAKLILDSGRTQKPIYAYNSLAGTKDCHFFQMYRNPIQLQVDDRELACY